MKALYNIVVSRKSLVGPSSLHLVNELGNAILKDDWRNYRRWRTPSLFYCCWDNPGRIFRDSAVNWHPDIAIVCVDNSRSTKDQCHMTILVSRVKRRVTTVTYPI